MLNIRVRFLFSILSPLSYGHRVDGRKLSVSGLSLLEPEYKIEIEIEIFAKCGKEVEIRMG